MHHLRVTQCLVFHNCGLRFFCINVLCIKQHPPHPKRIMVDLKGEGFPLMEVHDVGYYNSYFVVLSQINDLGYSHSSLLNKGLGPRKQLQHHKEHITARPLPVFSLLRYKSCKKPTLNFIQHTWYQFPPVYYKHENGQSLYCIHTHILQGKYFIVSWIFLTFCGQHFTDGF